MIRAPLWTMVAAATPSMAQLARAQILGRARDPRREVRDHGTAPAPHRSVTKT